MVLIARFLLQQHTAGGPPMREFVRDLAMAGVIFAGIVGFALFLGCL